MCRPKAHEGVHNGTAYFFGTDVNAVGAADDDFSELFFPRPGAFVLLDPDFFPALFEWMVIEKYCDPQMVLINNENLPDHAGHIKNHLLGKNGKWVEVFSDTWTGPDVGASRRALGGVPELVGWTEERRFSLLARRTGLFGRFLGAE